MKTSSYLILLPVVLTQLSASQKYDLSVSDFQYLHQEKVIPCIDISIKDVMSKDTDIILTYAQTVDKEDRETFTTVPEQSVIYARFTYKF